MDFEEIFIVLIVFSALTASIVTICLAIYFAKKLEHKQILAAIEKGTPLSELRPLKPVGLLWIRYLTAGIAWIIIAAGLFFWLYDRQEGFTSSIMIPFIFFAIGVSWLIRGLLYRKYQSQIQPSDKGDTTVNNKLPSTN